MRDIWPAQSSTRYPLHSAFTSDLEHCPRIDSGSISKGDECAAIGRSDREGKEGEKECFHGRKIHHSVASPGEW